MTSTPRRTRFAALPLLLALVAAGCGGTFSVPDPEPRRALDPSWLAELHANPILTYRPREWATPAVDPKSGVVYVGSNDGQLIAFDGATGRERWRYRTSGPIWAAPLVVGGTVYVGNADGQVLALDAKTGEATWPKPFQADGAVMSRLAEKDGRLFVTLDTNEVRALDAGAGDPLWSYRRDHRTAFTLTGQAPAVVWQDSVITGFSDGTAVALQVETGDVLWERPLASDASRFQDIDSAPVVVEGTVYVAAHASGVHALDARTGDVLWTHPLVGADGVAADGVHVWYADIERPAIVCLDRATGERVWRSPFDRGAPSTPEVAAGYLFVATTHDLYVMDAASGQFVERFAPNEGFSAQPRAAKGRLFALSNRGYLHALTIH